MMKLKTFTHEGKVYAETADGKPVYVYDDGKEIGFDAPGNVEKIRGLNAEAKTHREAKEAAEENLKKFAGIEDPDAARTAMEIVANLKDEKLVAAGKVDEIKQAAKKAADERVAELEKTYKTQIDQLTKNNADLRNGWDSEKIGTRFANSKYVSERLAVPGAVAQKIFGDNFRIEDGREVAYDNNGKKIYSRESPGDAAPFDEALSALVDSYAFRDSLVKGSGGGSGGRGGQGGNGLGSKEIGRDEFDRLSPQEKSVKMSEGFAVVDAA